MSTEKSYNFYQDYLMVSSSKLTLSKNVEQYLYLKRAYDIFLATVGLIIALPIVLLFSILIVLETPGSPFYVQERMGKNGKRFMMMKLRSMRMDAEKEGAKWAEVNDPRVTKVGAFIRKTRIDELPQLVSVLKGDMSIIGPRPERPFFTAKFNKEIKGFENRLIVKPGLTGLAQVSGGYDMSPREKLQYDLAYIQNLTFSLEVKIIVKTIKVIFTGEGAR
ncbi:sugar transferase [Neobacillus sp. SuZ13]|uniref:sugar transferase n=1 Tax=Neobacillus sp. SuZ13 TaxID=3047875 RepID=UPI0024C09369|nr:sugar transferase [Neobacillus sp. SuZ13]WHY64624.1 sugar transferase [Neobacillus sp. SuZ13]